MKTNLNYFSILLKNAFTFFSLITLITLCFMIAPDVIAQNLLEIKKTISPDGQNDPIIEKTAKQQIFNEMETGFGISHIISGKTCYLGKANAGSPAPNLPTYNPVIYDIDGVIVILKTQPGGVELARDTSDALGVYQFNTVADGNYTLSYYKYTTDTMQWGNSVNAIDVAMLKYLIGVDTLTDPSRSFSAKYKRTANVDNNTSINAVDIERIKAKIGSPYDVTKNFPRGNWAVLDTNICMAGANLNITLETVCYGDYNASSSKYRDSLNTWSLLKVLQKDIISTSEESVIITNPSYFEVPLRISDKLNDFSAMGLELTYPNKEYELVTAEITKSVNKNGPTKINPTLEEIISEKSDLLVTEHDGIIRVVYATTHHFDLAGNDLLINLGFKSIKQGYPGLQNFSLTGTGVFANQYGDEQDGSFLLIPKIYLQESSNGAEYEFTGYPNPFRGDAITNYNLPENGHVSLKVYNTIGELVTELVNENQLSGKHTVVFSGDNLAAGMYTFKLEFTGEQKSNCIVLKMIR